MSTVIDWGTDHDGVRIGATTFPGGARPDGMVAVAGALVRPLRLGEREELMVLLAQDGASARPDSRISMIARLIAGAATVTELAAGNAGAGDHETTTGAADRGHPVDGAEWAGYDPDAVAVQAVALQLAGASVPGSLARTTVHARHLLGVSGVAQIGALAADRLVSPPAPAAAAQVGPAVDAGLVDHDDGWTRIRYDEPPVTQTSTQLSPTDVRDLLAARLLARHDLSIEPRRVESGPLPKEDDEWIPAETVVNRSPSHRLADSEDTQTPTRPTTPPTPDRWSSTAELAEPVPSPVAAASSDDRWNRPPRPGIRGPATDSTRRERAPVGVAGSRALEATSGAGPTAAGSPDTNVAALTTAPEATGQAPGPKATPWAAATTRSGASPTAPAAGAHHEPDDGPAWPGSAAARGHAADHGHDDQPNQPHWDSDSSPSPPLQGRFPASRHDGLSPITTPTAQSDPPISVNNGSHDWPLRWSTGPAARPRPDGTSPDPAETAAQPGRTGPGDTAAALHLAADLRGVPR